MKSQKKTAKLNKSPYKAPTLKKHGSFNELTLAKGGTKADGAAKPASRLNGASS